MYWRPNQSNRCDPDQIVPYDLPHQTNIWQQIQRDSKPSRVPTFDYRTSPATPVLRQQPPCAQLASGLAEDLCQQMQKMEEFTHSFAHHCRAIRLPSTRPLRAPLFNYQRLLRSAGFEVLGLIEAAHFRAVLVPDGVGLGFPPFPCTVLIRACCICLSEIEGHPGSA
jgi:hypothetical protein